MKVVEVVFMGIIALAIVNVLVRQSSNTANVVTASGTSLANVFTSVTKSS